MIDVVAAATVGSLLADPVRREHAYNDRACRQAGATEADRASGYAIPPR
jgi:hypothetical protein